MTLSFTSPLPKSAGHAKLGLVVLDADQYLDDAVGPRRDRRIRSETLAGTGEPNTS